MLKTYLYVCCLTLYDTVTLIFSQQTQYVDSFERLLTINQRQVDTLINTSASAYNANVTSNNIQEQ